MSCFYLIISLDYFSEKIEENVNFSSIFKSHTYKCIHFVLSIFLKNLNHSNEMSSSNEVPLSLQMEHLHFEKAIEENCIIYILNGIDFGFKKSTQPSKVIWWSRELVHLRQLHLFSKFFVTQNRYVDLQCKFFTNKIRTKWFCVDKTVESFLCVCRHEFDSFELYHINWALWYNFKDLSISRLNKPISHSFTKFMNQIKSVTLPLFLNDSRASFKSRIPK